MIKNYFKIFLKVASQNKLFTFLSLFGISLTIMFVMIFSMTISRISEGSGPEADLKKIIFSERIKSTSHNGTNIGSLSRRLCEDNLKNAKGAEFASMYCGPLPWEFIFNGKYQMKAQSQTDAEFWKVFNFNFLQGRPYITEEVKAGENLTVISESLRELLFGDEKNVLGRTIRYTSMNLTVIGVVEDPPKTALNASGDLYFPYTLLVDVDRNNESFEYAGGFRLAYKAGSSAQLKAVRKDVQDIIARIDAADTARKIFLSGPYSQLEKMMVGYADPEDYSLGISVARYLLFAFAFLLLPAINLMALNFARIHERGEEIAVRKSFGASGSVLRGQFLFENILMTLAGGVIGILLSYIVVALLGSSLSLGVSFMSNVPLTFSFNYLVFVAALISCLIFGLLSGFLPAVRLSRMRPAVYLKGGEL